MEGGRQGRIVLLDQARLEGPNRDALVDFAIFVGLTGVQVHGAAVDGNRFSYLNGGGDLADMAGDNEGHFGKLCIAVGLIEGVCNGKIAADLTAEQMASQIDHVSDQCGPASALVGQLKYMYSLVRQAGQIKWPT